eukprot:g17526.t1
MENDGWRWFACVVALEDAVARCSGAGRNEGCGGTRGGRPEEGENDAVADCRWISASLALLAAGTKPVKRGRRARDWYWAVFYWGGRTRSRG